MSFGHLFFFFEVNMKKAVIGILAHVDAGKTTLAESVLLDTGVLRSAGRVDSGNTALDTHSLEKERGITIFSSQAVFRTGNREFTLLDTPGHVDFSCETERTLRVIDAAVLVISGTDGVQAHTKTIGNLLELYRIPVFIFVTKMDYSRKTEEELIQELCRDFSPDCVNFSDTDSASFREKVAMCSESLLEKYLGGEDITREDLSRRIFSRKVFPVFFGSGLKNTGVEEFVNALDYYFEDKMYPDVFGARAFKISHDKETRLTHLKVTGGTLKVRDSVTIDGKAEKISRIRIYTGAKYETVDEAAPGTVCAVEGLSLSSSGQGFGFEDSFYSPYLEPVMKFRLGLPDGCDVKEFMPKLRELEEEEPGLNVTWNDFLKQIQIGLMGDIQAEILKAIIKDRYGVDVTIDEGKIQYKETIANTVEGVGHYEPLRHYAEVHLIMEPLPRGSGLVFRTQCSEDALSRNWQRLILAHLNEKHHLGVLTGSPVTDMKITLAAGRAHLKHTEGGDFRQSTYRAVRQGLMQAESVLLEPYYAFTLLVPFEQLGRAINDIRMRSGTFNSPEEQGEMALIKGTAPVATMNGYASEVASYTSGRGRFGCIPAGYDKCHNSEEVIASMNYNPEGDLENSPDSVFCAHGAGFAVKWDKVPEYMHLESCLKKGKDFTPSVNHRNLRIDDKELEAIMEREFGPVKYELYRPSSYKNNETANEPEPVERKSWIIVDGYNVIFAWQDLKELAQTDLSAARQKLMEILCNYSAFTKENVVLVFDAYMVSGNQGERFDFHNIHVVYTKERESGDVYIEKLVKEIGKNDKVRVVSSDGLIQLSAVRYGVLRLSSREFEEEVDSVHEKISEFLKELKSNNPVTKLGEI